MILMIVRSKNIPIFIHAKKISNQTKSVLSIKSTFYICDTFFH